MFGFGVDVCFNDPEGVAGEEIIGNCIDIEYVGNVYCRTDQLSTIDEYMCREAALQDGLSGLSATNNIIGGRSLVHSDSTYLMAQLLGFSPWTAYQIMIYSEATDQGDYEPFDQRGNAILTDHEISACRANWGPDMPPGCLLLTPDVSGLYKFNSTTGGMWLHMQPRYTPSSTERPVIGYPANYFEPDNIQYESTLRNLDDWVFDKRENYCVLGLTTEMENQGSACETPQEIVIAGTFLQAGKKEIQFNTTLGQFVINEENQIDATNESLARYLHPQESAYAKLGIYIHAMGDRISHHLCVDRFFIWKNDLGEYENEYYAEGCAQGLHFLAHVWEQGTDQSNLENIDHKTMRPAIEYDFEILERYASHIGISENLIGQKEEIIADIMEVLQINEAHERLDALVQVMEAKYHVLPLPKHGTYYEQSIEDWLRDAGALEIPEPGTLTLLILVTLLKLTIRPTRQTA